MIRRVNHKIDRKQQQSGVMLVSVMVIAAVLIVISFSLASLTTSQYAISNQKVYTANSMLVAEAGIEQSLHEINQNENFGGFASEQEFFNNAVQGRGVFTTTITDSESSNSKTVTSVGKVYRFGNASKPVSTRRIKVNIVGTSSAGYSVHTGPGGLILGGSANITNSDVYVNGFIDMSGSAKIGTNAQPVNVNVAHRACPTGPNPGSSYPQVCTSGEPISLKQSTLIYGTVCATNQTSVGPRKGGNILPGTSGQGLLLGCVAPEVVTPTYNKAAQLANVAVTGSSGDNSYVCNKWPFERSWPANLKLTGNVSVAGSCDITIHGDVYITGNLSLGGASQLKIADDVGARRPTIVVDGTIDVGGSSRIIANSSGTGAHFISFKASASCNPNCTNLSGNDLKASQSQQIVSIGGGVDLPGMIFQAYWGKITIAGSGNIGSAIGQTIDMSGAGTITFGTSLSSGSRSWTITSYQQEFIDT